jgi:hypothetical protein
MAYDLEIPTPKGRIGLNLVYLSSTLMDTVINAYVQQSDGTWKYMGYLAVGGVVNVSGTPDLILARMLEQEGVATTADVNTVRAWLGSRTQEAALNTIIAWIKRVIGTELIAFLNRVIGVTPGQSPTAPAASQPFGSAEHALRTALKSLAYKVDPVTSEVSL